MHTNLKVVSIKRKRATDKCVEYDPKTPNVHLWAVVLLTLEKLWGCIGGTATKCVQLATRRELIAESKVSYLDVHVSI